MAARTWWRAKPVALSSHLSTEYFRRHVIDPLAAGIQLLQELDYIFLSPSV